MLMQQQLINHVALVLDESSSMCQLAPKLVEVVDNLTKHLANRSRETDQETRITVYAFNHEVRCLFYDKDVLRLPSIKDFYRPNGMTALIDATLKSQHDLAKTAQLYGDHAFLTYVLTDGAENRSKNLPSTLASNLGVMPENWSVAVLVPDQYSIPYAKRVGFPADNIAVWDATSVEGVMEVGAAITRATDTFIENRARGVRGSRTIFTGGNVTKEAVKDAGLKHLPRTNYLLVPVKAAVQISPFVQNKTGKPYVAGQAFYELMKPEKIQATKKVCVRNRKTGRVYTGEAARKLLSLPDHEVRVRPEDNKDFQIFVQSTSHNRKLVADTKLLVMKS